MTENKTFFGNYEIIERVARGGMAEVFKARLKGVGGFQKTIAIKTIHDYYSDNLQFVEMFAHEAKLASQLTHPNIIQILEFGEVNNTYYMAMEYLEGPDLRVILKKCIDTGTRIPVHLSVYVMSKICAALDYAHRKTDEQGNPLNIIHRDVAPSNVLISYEGNVKLADFGIAKAEREIAETRTGIVKGKLNYLSPEQLGGDKLDSRSDIFSTGSLLYELLTNQKTFAGEKEFDVLENIDLVKYKSPLVYAADIPREIVSIISKCLLRNREHRYQHARDVQHDLAGYLSANHFPTLEIELGDFVKGLVTREDYKKGMTHPTPKYIILDDNSDTDESKNKHDSLDLEGETQVEMMVDKMRRKTDRFKPGSWKITDFFNKEKK